MFHHLFSPSFSVFFFFNDTATTKIYTLSLHDALPIYNDRANLVGNPRLDPDRPRSESTNMWFNTAAFVVDRKSTRLNSSHPSISYAVFCLIKKKMYNLMSEFFTV